MTTLDDVVALGRLEQYLVVVSTGGRRHHPVVVGQRRRDPVDHRQRGTGPRHLQAGQAAQPAGHPRIRDRALGLAVGQGRGSGRLIGPTTHPASTPSGFACAGRSSRRQWHHDDWDAYDAEMVEQHRTQS